MLRATILVCLSLGLTLADVILDERRTVGDENRFLNRNNLNQDVRNRGRFDRAELVQDDRYMPYRSPAANIREQSGLREEDENMGYRSPSSYIREQSGLRRDNPDRQRHVGNSRMIDMPADTRNEFSEVSRMERDQTVQKSASTIARYSGNDDNDLFGRILEDDLQDLNQTIHVNENQLIGLMNLYHLPHLVFPFDAEDKLLCDVKEHEIFFVLYTKNTNGTALFRIGEHDKIQNSSFNVNKKTEILVHDWIQSGDSVVDQVASTYFQTHDVDINLVLVDWSIFSTCEYLYTTKKIVPSVGLVLSKFIKELITYGANVKDIHIIGHGIGAQIASVAGKQFVNNKIARITGLDPAGPGFNLQPATHRLDSTDADFVDVIHTNMNLFGTYKNVGHVDFYPNGGFFQNGCYDMNSCCHERSLTFYLESLNTLIGFYGVDCEEYINYKFGLCKGNEKIIMGEHTPTSARGKYYLETFVHSPYAKGKNSPKVLANISWSKFLARSSL